MPARQNGWDTAEDRMAQSERGSGAMGLSTLERSRLADALDLWRSGERHVTRRALNSDWHDDYQAAVQAALLHLQRYATMAELLYVMRNQGTPVCLPDRWGSRGGRAEYRGTCGQATGSGR